jgi:hypothetical protein
MPAAAQTIGIGIRGGYNFAFANRGGDTIGDPNQGIVLGAAATLELFPAFALQGGIQYVKKNNRFELVLPGGETRTESYQFDYLELPLSMTLDFGSGSPRLYGLLGTTVGTLLVATGGDPEQNADTTDYSESLDPIDMSVDIGLGAALDLSEHMTFLVEAKYNYGLLDIYHHTETATNLNSWRARDLKAIAGLYFSL